VFAADNLAAGEIFFADEALPRDALRLAMALSSMPSAAKTIG
jgi:hypothetical protein